MVNIIINIAILLLLAVRLISWTWPSDAIGILNTLSLIVLSAAAGIAVKNLIDGQRK